MFLHISQMTHIRFGIMNSIISGLAQCSVLKKQDAQDLILNSELVNGHEWGTGTDDGSNRTTVWYVG